MYVNPYQPIIEIATYLAINCIPSELFENNRTLFPTQAF